MAIKPKQILDTAVDVGKAAVSAAERRLRGSESTSGEPSTVGAAKPGKPRGPKSATASMTSPRKPAKRKPPAKKPKPQAKKDKTSTPRKRATGRRSTASQAAASSGKDVADAASGKDE
jgi:hypothetical protein